MSKQATSGRLDAGQKNLVRGVAKAATSVYDSSSSHKGTTDEAPAEQGSRPTGEDAPGTEAETLQSIVTGGLKDGEDARDRIRTYAKDP
ncbi:MAG: hypothetical protein NDJ90_06365 [Oligoflexia bacterium]|nr:hypothetical protein [Oligoflexia bacterium]